jgi:hypothetical protein
MKYSTMSGGDSVVGVTYLTISIGKITKKMKIYVVNKDKFKYGILIGLDMIKEFRLCQDHNLNISQSISTAPVKTCVKQIPIGSSQEKI